MVYITGKPEESYSNAMLFYLYVLPAQEDGSGFLKLVFAFCGEEAAVSSFIAACVHFRMAV